MTPTAKIRLQCATEYKRIRKILRANGYLKRVKKPMTEAQRVKQEGRA